MTQVAPVATVFNLQKFSLDDGPGIRTVIFLKGCPLRCAWCANPESQLAAPQVEWDARSCVGCGTCAAGSDAVTLEPAIGTGDKDKTLRHPGSEAPGQTSRATERSGSEAAGHAGSEAAGHAGSENPQGGIAEAEKRHASQRAGLQHAASQRPASQPAQRGASQRAGLTGRPRVRVNHAAVTDAEAVAALCPHGALSVAGQSRTLDDVVEQCLKDLPFFEESGGGVTVSGGEPLLWPAFVRDLADRLHEHGVPVAIETTGLASPETFSSVLQKLDYLLMDLKHWDEAAHRQGTGVGRDRIARNMAAALRWSEQTGNPVLFRTPVIPGFNDRAPGADGPQWDAAADGLAGALMRARQEAGTSATPRLQLLPFHQFGQNKYDQLGMPYAFEAEKGLRHEDLEPLVAALRARGIDAFV